jgi:hypothetical protein
VREAANSCVLPKALSGGAKVLLRMLNDPRQSETGRQMARANPKYRRRNASSQGLGAAQSRAVKSSTALGAIILFVARATRGNIRRTGHSRVGGHDFEQFRKFLLKA